MTDESEEVPVRLIRSLILVMPLAILFVGLVAPPDPFTQLFIIIGALAVGLPLAYRFLRSRRYGPLELAAFFVIVLGIVLGGVWLLSLLGPRPIPSVAGRIIAFAIALVLADFVVFRLPRQTSE
jgi:hypothetical protein